jgi:hypothetical protein
MKSKMKNSLTKKRKYLRIKVSFEDDKEEEEKKDFEK